MHKRCQLFNLIKVSMLIYGLIFLIQIMIVSVSILIITPLLKVTSSMSLCLKNIVKNFYQYQKKDKVKSIAKGKPKITIKLDI